jgi:hypothetical protein
MNEEDPCRFNTILTLRSLDAILTMLHLNNKEAAVAAASALSNKTSLSETAITLSNDPVWKVLIYDQAGQEIISPLLKVNELREHGITVHM